MTKIDLKILS